MNGGGVVGVQGSQDVAVRASGNVLSSWRERQRTSSAELEMSAAISLGTQLDSSLVLVAEVCSLFALRARPIVRDVVVWLLRAPGRRG